MGYRSFLFDIIYNLDTINIRRLTFTALLIKTFLFFAEHTRRLSFSW